MKWKTLVGTMVLGVSLSTPSFAGLLDRMLGLKGCGCDSTCCDTAPACSASPSCGCESACGTGCGSGCGAAPSCGCESACGPACGSGCGAAPSCGCESACGSGCGAAPSCGCESSCAAAPSCGCETSCCKPRRKPLLELLNAIHCRQRSLFNCNKGCCDSGCAPSCGCESACAVAPSCGCESACGSGCGAAPSCGCEVSAPCGCDSGCGRHRGGLLGKIFKKRGCCDALACDSGCAAPACSSCGSAPVAAPEVHGNMAPAAPAPIVDPSAYLQSNRRVIQATSYVR